MTGVTRIPGVETHLELDAARGHRRERLRSPGVKGLLVRRKALLSGLFLSCFICTHAGANSTSRVIGGHTITFQFNCGGQECRSGQFVNGEYWAVPVTVSGAGVPAVTITGILPSGVDNSAESNPSTDLESGILTGWGGYVASKNIMTKLPYDAKPGESIIKMVAKSPSSACINPEAKVKGCAAAFDVLTILNTVPPDNGATIFRPPYAGSEKPLRTLAQVRKERLPRIQAISDMKVGKSSFPDIVARWNSPGYELCRRWQIYGQKHRSAMAMDVIGADYGADYANAYLSDMLSLFGTETSAQKDAAVYALMQQGFDNYAIYKLGIPFGSGAGQLLGVKPTIVFSAALYDDRAVMKDVHDAVNKPWTSMPWFQEDDQVFKTANSATPVWGNRDGELTYWTRIFLGDNNKTGADPYGYIDGPPGGPPDHRPDNNSYMYCCSIGPYASYVFASHLMPYMSYTGNNFTLSQFIDRSWNGRGVPGFSGGWWGAPDPCAPPDPNESAACNPWTGGFDCLFYKKTWGPDPNNPGECIHHNGDPMKDGRYSNLQGAPHPPSEWYRLSYITLSLWSTLRDCADPAHPTYPCAGLGPEVPAFFAPLNSLTAQPASIASGESTTLTWSSTDADVCSGSGFDTGNAKAGSVKVGPLVTTTYELTCQGAGGRTTSSVKVSVFPAPETEILMPNPMTGVGRVRVFSESGEGVRVKVYNMGGEKVWEKDQAGSPGGPDAQGKRYYEIMLEINELPSGNYLVETEVRKNGQTERAQKKLAVVR